MAKKSICISFHRSDTGKVFSPDHCSSNTMDTADWFYWGEVFICLELHWTTWDFWVFNLPACDHMSFPPIYIRFLPFSALSLFQRGKEWATFGHQTGTWEHGSGVQKDSARGSALKTEGPLHTHCTFTQKHFNEIIFFHLLFLLVPYHFVSAALPGFNQPASDLTH